jgi:transposase-like protein
MAGRRRVAKARQDRSSKGRRFTAEVVLWAVRWHLVFPVGYRGLGPMPRDRGVGVDHATILRRIQACAPGIGERVRPHLRASDGPWRVDGRT